MRHQHKIPIAAFALIGLIAAEANAQNAANPVVPLAAPAATPAAFGAVTGTVIDSSTHDPVPLAVVVAERQPDTGPRNGATNSVAVSTRTARTRADGSYTISDLPAGTYEICVHALQSQWLNSCLWSNNRPSADVKENKTTNNGQIRIDKGAVLKLRLDDPGQSAVNSVNTAPGTELLIGPRGKRGFLQRPRMVSRDASGINYEILVPAGQKVPLSVLAKSYKLADSNGKAVGLVDGDFSVTIPGGATEQSVTVTITGRK